MTEARLASQKNPIIIHAAPTTIIEKREPSEILQELVNPAKKPAKKRKRVTKEKKKKKEKKKEKETASLEPPPHKKKRVAEIISRSIKKSAELLQSFELNPEKRFLYNAMVEKHLRHETINAGYCFSTTESMVYFLCLQAAFKKCGTKTNQGHVYALCEPFFKIFNWGLRSKATVSKKYTALLFYADRDFGKYVEKDLREYAAKTFLKERLDVINKCLTIFQGDADLDFCNTIFPKLQLQYFPMYYHPIVYLHGYKYNKLSENKRKNKARTGIKRIAENAEKAYVKMRLFAHNFPTDQQSPHIETQKTEEVDAMSIDTSPLPSSPPPFPISETIVQERIISFFLFFFIICVRPKKYTTHKKKLTALNNTFRELAERLSKCVQNDESTTTTTTKLNGNSPTGIQTSTLGIKNINKIQNLERNGKIDIERPHKVLYDIQKLLKPSSHVLYKRGYHGYKTGEIDFQGQNKFGSVRIGQGNTSKIETKGFPSRRISELRSNSRQQSTMETPRTHVVANNLSNYRRVPANQYMVTTPHKKFQSYPVTMQ